MLLSKPLRLHLADTLNQVIQAHDILQELALTIEETKLSLRLKMRHSDFTVANLASEFLLINV